MLAEFYYQNKWIFWIQTTRKSQNHTAKGSNMVDYHVPILRRESLF